MFEERSTQVATWLKSAGPESEIVFSSRVRLARNLRGMPFTGRATPSQQREVVSLVKGAAQRTDVLAGAEAYDYRDLDSVDKQFLAERYLISAEHATGEGERAVIVGPREGLSLMVNEEDHLRMQVLRGGLQLHDAWEALDRTDNALDPLLDFAFDERLGFLTACPSNTGTGLRASVMVHLPALVLSRTIAEVLDSTLQMRLAVRGIYGEGSEAVGDFFQVSNQVTLGVSEAEILTMTEHVTRDIVARERAARQDLLAKRRLFVEDRVSRALGILTHARMIGTREAMERLSDLRLGVALGLLPQVSTDKLNELVIAIQPAHVQKRNEGHLDPKARDEARARLITQTLSCGEG